MALETDAEGARDDAWALPDWEEYSEAARSSFVGDWSDVEADVSLDTASSVASTEHQRVYRIQRARGGFSDKKQRELRDIHSLYTRRRLEEFSQGAPSVRSSANWFQPTTCVSPRVQEQVPVSKEGEQQVGSELLAQQSEISSELQAVRRQLSDFQDKWHKTVEGKAQEMQSSGAPTVASSWSSPGPVRGALTGEMAVQTDGDGEDAVKQWLSLLAQKLKTLARKYSHAPTMNFQAAMVHLDGLYSSKSDKETAEPPSNCNEDESPSLSSWHLGRGLKTAVSLEVAEQFLELEQAVACMNEAVEQHERRQMTNFDRAVQQVQGYHHERMQRVVDESLAELKLVRGRYKKKEAQLEDELRAANKEVEQWKQTATEADHRKKLDREALEFQLSSTKEQHGHACQRYEDNVALLNNQLKTLRAERKQVVSQHRDTQEVITQAKEGAEALERQCQALKKQQERSKELHNRELRILQDTIRQLQERNDEMGIQHFKEKQVFAETLEKVNASQQAETEAVAAQVRRDVEQQMLCEHLPEKMAVVEKHHEDVIRAMTVEHKRQLTQLAAELDEAKRVEPSKVCAVETQTDSLTANESEAAKNDLVDGDNQAQEQVEELTRRCRALEKLLDKKFEEIPRSLSSSRRCESCLSDDGISTSSVFAGRHDLSASRSSSIQSDSSFRSRVSGKSRALARALLGSSSASLNNLSLDNKAPAFDETTLATDEATLGAHEMWDSASFTSIDTVDDLSSFASQRTAPRQRMRSTQEILTVVRQIKHAAASPLGIQKERREPDPEVNWDSFKRKHAARDSSLSISKDSAKVATASLLPSARGDVSVARGASAFDDLLC